MNVLFLDVETTGLDPENHRLLQVAMRFDVMAPQKDNSASTYFDMQISQGIGDALIDLGALKVNKQSLKSVTDMTTKKTEYETVVKITDFILDLYKTYGEFVVCGHNVQFDISFLAELLGRYRITGLKNIFGYRVLDTAAIATFLKLCGILQVEKASLEDIAKSLGIETNGMHDAKFDVDLTAKVLYAMMDKV